MTPEQKARVSIDALLQQAGWHVRTKIDCHRLSFIRDVDAEVGTVLKRALTLLQEAHRLFFPNKGGKVTSFPHLGELQAAVKNQ